MNSPCKGCQDRSAGIPNCHETCEKYLAYHAEREMISEERAKSNGFAAYISDKRKPIDRNTADRFRRHRIKKKHM